MAENERAAPRQRSGAGEHSSAAGATEVIYSDDRSSSTRGLTRTATCTICSARFEARRASARFCSERCKKQSQRSGGGDLDRERQVVGWLIARRYAGRVWPVFKNDRSPTTLGLLVPRPTALAELCAARPDLALTDSELRQALRARGVLDWNEPIPALSGTKSRSRSRHSHPPRLSR